MMDFDLEQLVRPNIWNLVPYRSARDDFKSGTLLDANENSLGAPFENELNLHRYPMPYQEKLRSKIAAYRGVETDHVFVGVGSDEAIDLLFRIFCVPGKDRALINPPTYGMYAVSAATNDIGIDRVVLTADFQLDVDTILSSVQPNTKLIFICSPNNPTGNSIKADDILAITEQFSGIVVVDEAYIDFSNQKSLATEVKQHPNLVVLQTLSKAFGLAGIRLGLAIAQPDIIQLKMKVKAPYNVNALTSQAALNAFNHLDTVDTNKAALLKERDRVITQLKTFSEVEFIYPSDANFILFRVKNAKTIYQELARHQVIVRYRGNEPLCEDTLRLTIGTEAENDQFFNALSIALGS